MVRRGNHAQGPNARLTLGITTIALGLAVVAPPGALSAKPPAPDHVFQDTQLAPFDNSHTFVLKGKATPIAASIRTQT